MDEILEVYKMKSFITSDNYKVEIKVFNHSDYSAHIFISNKPDHNMGRPFTSSIHGRDTFEVLLSEGKYMTKDSIIRMFDLHHVR